LASRTCSENVIDDTGGEGGNALVIETTGTNAQGKSAAMGPLRGPQMSMGTPAISSIEARWRPSSAPSFSDAGDIPFSRSIRYFVIHLRNRLALISCVCAKRATDTPGRIAASTSARLLFSS
jgi:hypothetical protein